jgi:hypothetical protein
MLVLRFGRFVACVSSLIIFAGMSPAQTTQGGIVGAVRDEKGANILGAKITVTSPATGLQRSATTADNGVFRVLALPTGMYEVRAESPGFTTATVKDIEIGVDQVRTLDLVLRVSGTAETVTVEAHADLTQTESSKVGEIIDNRKVEDLPLNGRDFAQLARLSPGVAVSGGGGGQQGGEGNVSGFSSNGQRSTSNNFLVDGVDNNNYFAGEAAQLPSIDSIQEFEVQTNTFAAEYGRNSGSVVNLVTKSGTNQLHGSAYEFFRNDVLDARNFFNQKQFPKAGLHLNQFGGTLGGPILKNRTFFFLNYEGFRRKAGITRITNVPTLDQRAGTFTDASGVQFTVPVNPTSAQIFQLYPKPNLTSASGNFISSPAQSDGTDQFLVKIDHRLRNSDNLSARYSRTRIDTFFPFTPGQSGTNVPGYGVNDNGADHLVAISYTRVFTPRTLNEARFGFTRSNTQLATQLGPQATTYNINTGWPAGSPLGLGNIPQLSFSGGFVSGSAAVSNLGGAIDQPNRTAINTFQWVDNVSHTTARHDIKLGADIRYTQLNRLYDLAFSGQVSFSGLQNTAENGMNVPNALIDFAEGLSSGALQFVGDSHRNFRTTSYGIFGQDSFKLRKNLTLNYGLRYELNTVLHEAHGRLSTFRPQNFTQFLDPNNPNIQTDLPALHAAGIVTQSDVGGIYDPDHNNVAPRIGLAWDVFEDGKTVFRSGYGVFYETIIGNIPGNVMLNPPFLPDFFNAFPVWPAKTFAPSGFPVLTVTQQKLRTPYAQHYNLLMQHELPGKALMEIGYVGTSGTKLPRFRQIDQAFITPEQLQNLTPDLEDRLLILGLPPAAAHFLASNIASNPSTIAAIPNIARTPFFGYAQLFQAEDTISSNYNSLQAKLDKRFSHGLSFLMAYTWSKSIDGASVFFGSGANGTTIFPQDNYNLKAERGLSDFDIRQRLSWSFLYELPNLRALPKVLGDGWQLGGILSLQTGQPFSVLTGSDNSGTGLGNDRPDLIGDPNAGPHTVSRWFNTAAFTPNAALTFGNAGRNIVTGPGFHNFDFSVVKNTHFRERVNAQFRAEFFNITNHPNFALPANILAAPNFGTLFQTPDAAQNNVGLGSGGPRLIQFALKLSF